MLYDLSIGGVRPIDDKPSRRNNGKNRGQGKKFSLDQDGDEEGPGLAETVEKPAQRRKAPLPAEKHKEGGIDIVI